MTKRAAGKHAPRLRDFWPTPPDPIWKLVPHLKGVHTFAEPMCGDGAIIRTLEEAGFQCLFAADLEPMDDAASYAEWADVRDTQAWHYLDCDVIVSNPPWPWPTNRRPKGEPDGWPSVPIIQHLMKIKPTWMLLSSDFAHNRYFLELEPFCRKIVSVGRVKWITDSQNTGFDNAAWYLFDADAEGAPEFRGNFAAGRQYHPDVEDLL